MVQAEIKKEEIGAYVFYFLIAVVLILFAEHTFATQSGTSANATLIIWTIGTANSQNLTYGENNVAWTGYKTESHWNFYFYANYTNSSGSVINASNGNGNCTIRFNETGIYSSFSNMTYNSTSFLWQFNRSFSYKGNLSFNINCTSSFGNISLNDSFWIKNSNLRKFQDTLIFSAYEDAITIYDFSKNVTDDDTNDIPLSFSIENITLNNINGTYPWIYANSTGAIFSNATNSTQNGTYTLVIRISDSGEGGVVVPEYKALELAVTAVNDPPVFVNLENQTMNMSLSSSPTKFEYIVNITDEENNVPFTLNISFLNCSVASWSNRNCSNSSGRGLFNSTQYSFNGTTGVLNISFYPSRNDVGNFTINFSVMDLNNGLAPYNASTSKIVSFNVLPLNTPPILTYICDNNRNATEDSLFTCVINATDIEESTNLTFSANYSWFVFNSTNLSFTNGTTTQFANITNNTNFTSFAIVNFTPSDLNVGNWTINITITDAGWAGTAAKSTSYFINFSIANVPDNVTLNPIINYTSASGRRLFNSLNYTIYVNASDDDILIPDKRIYNESINFTSNYSWVNVTACSSNECNTIGTNKSTAKIIFFLNSSILGNYSILINATDKSNSSSSREFFIEVFNNSAPVWNLSSFNFSYNEGNAVYLNLSQNVTDIDRQNITFSFVVNNIENTSFPSFSINATTGIINFTPDDVDVGFHIVIINASDNITNSLQTLNFTIYNTPDAPVLPAGNAYNAITNISINNSNNYAMNTTEDKNVTIYLTVFDDDFRINASQKAQFGNETLNINTIVVNSSGSIKTFLNFTYFSFADSNRTTFSANFLTNRTNLGNYTVNVNVTDNFNMSVFSSFNLSIIHVAHFPEIAEISTLRYSIFENFSYLNLNASDADEDFGICNCTYNLTMLSAGNNFLKINSSTGVVTNLSGAENFSLAQYAGFWEFNFTAKDGTGLNSSRVFNLSVYDYLKILSPDLSTSFNMAENVSSILTFIVNHSVKDSLNYTLLINSTVKNQTLGYGNATAFSLSLTPNFTDETYCNGASFNITLTLNVSNYKLKNSTSWNLTINHTNYPLEWNSNIGGASKYVNGSNSVTLSLEDYTLDYDAYYSGSCRSQNISFSYIVYNVTNNTNITNTNINVTITNWTKGNMPRLTFTLNSGNNATANYSIIAYERSETDNSILRNVSSNNFTVYLVRAVGETKVPTSGGGTPSGGGGTTEVPKKPTPEDERRIVLLKLVLPDPVSAFKKKKIILPISLVNNVNVTLQSITLSSAVSKNGVFFPSIVSFFDVDRIPYLNASRTKNVTLTVAVDTNEEGLYEIMVNASVQSPAYSDWGKIFLNVRNITGIEEKLMFIDELIIGNPECAELKEIVNEAKKNLENNNSIVAEEKLNEAISACRQAISQRTGAAKRTPLQELILNYLSITTVIFFVLGVFYYLYKRRNFKLMMVDYSIDKK
jgi:hypothetical protein